MMEWQDCRRICVLLASTDVLEGYCQVVRYSPIPVHGCRFVLSLCSPICLFLQNNEPFSRGLCQLTSIGSMECKRLESGDELALVHTMPFGDPPDYVHLRTNESQMQLISMGEQPETPSGSPCFNSPSTREEAPAVVFVPGKINALNTSVDPCEDFYEFACGSWNEDHPIPDDMSAFGTFSFVREQVRQQLR
ncbi:hypothetical protein TELCIR_08028, partial [Teladorsagia circumcincta]